MFSFDHNHNYMLIFLQGFTSKLILMFNLSLLGCITASTYFLAHGHRRVSIVGWICAAFSVSVFAAPLTIMVINNLTTKKLIDL